MAGSINKVILIGNLGADPEVRTTPSGQQVATLSLATSRGYKDREGNKREETEWHRVIAWGQLAELAQRYLAKGRKVYIEGRLQTRSWDDTQTGQKKYTTEIIADQLTFLDSGSGGERQPAPAQGGQGATRPQSTPASAPASAPAPRQGELGGDPGFYDDDECPF